MGGNSVTAIASIERAGFAGDFVELPDSAIAAGGNGLSSSRHKPSAKGRQPRHLARLFRTSSITEE